MLGWEHIFFLVQNIAWGMTVFTVLILILPLLTVLTDPPKVKDKQTGTNPRMQEKEG